MTRDEFWHAYRTFRTDDKQKAISEAARVNTMGIRDTERMIVDVAVPLHSPSGGWVLVLSSATQYITTVFVNSSGSEQGAS